MLWYLYIQAILCFSSYLMPHILFILDYYLPHRGGVETVFEQVISRLLKKWYKITLLTSRFDRKLPAFEQEWQLSIYRVWSGRFWFLFSAIFKWISLLRAFPEIKNIHASTYGSAIQSSILWKLFHKRVILTVHEVFGKLWYVYKGFWKGLLYLFFERLLFLFSYDKYHCVSRYTMNSLRLLYGISDDKLHLIYNGVDTDFWNPNTLTNHDIVEWKSAHDWVNKTVCLYYGHAGKSKGLDFLLDAIPSVLNKQSDFLFVFNIIDSKRKSLLVACLKKLQHIWYKDHIQIFYGMDKIELRKLVASCDVVVAPSLSEWFGSVHTETVSMDKPLITTFVASIPEVVHGNVSFVAPQSVQWIINALLWFRKNQHVVWDVLTPSFDWDATVLNIEKLYL